MEKIMNPQSLVLPREVLVVPETLTIVKARNVFSHIDLALKDRNIFQLNHQKSFLIKPISLDSTFKTIFAGDLEDLIIEDNAIVQICLENKDLLEGDKQSMFFFLGGTYVAKVNSYSDGLHINRYNLNSPITWHAKRGHLAVFPK